MAFLAVLAHYNQKPARLASYPRGVTVVGVVSKPNGSTKLCFKVREQNKITTQPLEKEEMLIKQMEFDLGTDRIV